MTEAPTPIDLIDPVPERKARKARTNGKALAVANEAPAPAPADTKAPSLLAILQAVMTDPTASIERMNSAFDFYQRLEAAQARKAFEAAMAAAKAEFEPIVKRHLVNRGAGGTYKHEDLADIEAAVKPALSANGLSYRWRVTSKPNEPVSVTCVVTHEGGHFEETTLHAGADNSGGKNSIQGIGSTLTYLQRYTLKPALGLAASRDDDGKAADDKPTECITDAQCRVILDKIAETNSDLARFLAYFKIDAVEKLPANEYDRAIGLFSQKAGKQ